MQSTDVERTLQSGYSELLGIYPPGESGAFKLSQANLSALQSRGFPPLRVRNASKINEDLGEDALPNGMTSLPVPTFINDSLLDDCSYNGCPYVVSAESQRRASPEEEHTYGPYKYIAINIRDPVQTALNLTDEQVDTATFTDTYHWTDTIRCLKFDGFEYEDTFSPNQWLEA